MKGKLKFLNIVTLRTFATIYKRAGANKTGATLLGCWNLAPELLELQVCGVVLIFPRNHQELSVFYVEVWFLFICRLKLFWEGEPDMVKWSI